MAMETPEFEKSATPREANQFRFILNIVLGEHWRMIMAGTLAGCLALAVWAWMGMERPEVKYQTWTDVVIMPSPWEKDILKDVSGLSRKLTPKSLVERTSKRAICEEVAFAMVQRDLASGGELSRIATRQELLEKAGEIEGKLNIVPMEDAPRVRLEVKNALSRSEAEDIAEFAARVFLEENRQAEMKEGRETHEFILENLKDLQAQLFEAETAEWQYKQKTGFRTYGKVGDDMEAMYEELNEITITREEILSKLDELESELVMNTEQLPDSLDNVTDDVVDQLFIELNELLQKKLTMSTIYQPAYPEFQLLEEEIAEKQNAIMHALAQLDTGMTGGSSVWNKRQNIYKQQMDLRMQLTGIEVRAASLERMLAEMVPRIPELANRNLEYEKLVQETTSIRERFNKLREREWKIRTALQQGGSQVERNEPVRRAALMPVRSGQRSILVNLVIGAVIGFVLSFSLAMVIEVNDTSIRSIEDVNLYIGLEVIGTIPEMRFGKPRGRRRRRATYVTTVDEEQIDACIVTQHDPKSPISEAYRTLRTNYQFATIKEKPKTLMISSAVPGEGKTTTAVNMAVTMADRGMRVLIIDTDLRRPNVHRVLRMERGPGLADVLREGLDLSDVVRPTRIENLWVISSGRVPPNPSELIGSDAMSEIMRRVGEDFDLVICDAPSVLVVTDPVLLATHVETCVMVVSARNARRETVIRAKKLLETADVEVVGVVLNGLETTRRHYYYYYYYYDDAAPMRKKWYHFY
jgi:capsular exopolysaccharide synthesis family protein